MASFLGSEQDRIPAGSVEDAILTVTAEGPANLSFFEEIARLGLPVRARRRRGASGVEPFWLWRTPGA